MAQRFDELLSPRKIKRGVFEECHLAPFSRHAVLDNTLTQIKEWFYWPDYYKDTIEMVSYKLYLFANAPS